MCLAQTARTSPRKLQEMPLCPLWTQSSLLINAPDCLLVPVRYLTWTLKAKARMARFPSAGTDPSPADPAASNWRKSLCFSTHCLGDGTMHLFLFYLEEQFHECIEPCLVRTYVNRMYIFFLGIFYCRPTWSHLIWPEAEGHPSHALALLVNTLPSHPGSELDLIWGYWYMSTTCPALVARFEKGRSIYSMWNWKISFACSPWYFALWISKFNL